MEFLIESERLRLRRFTPEDKKTAAVFLQDPQVMYAWGHGYSETEVDAWLERSFARYAKTGYSWLYAEEKSTGRCIGAIGLIYNEKIGRYSGWELGYILKKEYWGRGLAAEGARACIRYAYNALGAERIFSEMRTDNIASVAVAERIGMRRVQTYDRDYNNETVPHYVYVTEKAEGEKNGTADGRRRID